MAAAAAAELSDNEAGGLSCSPVVPECSARREDSLCESEASEIRSVRFAASTILPA